MADLDAFFRRFYRRGEFQANEAQEALSGLTSVLQGLDVGRFAGLLNQPFSEVDLLQACRRGLWGSTWDCPPPWTSMVASSVASS
jgi:hypothetical protein